MEQILFTNNFLDRKTDFRKKQKKATDLICDDKAKLKLFVFHKGKILCSDKKEIYIFNDNKKIKELYDIADNKAFLGEDKNNFCYYACSFNDLKTFGKDSFYDLKDDYLLTDDVMGQACLFAKGLLNWHEEMSFCGKCKNKLENKEAGMLKKCPSCGQEYYPRTNPAVIMLVENPKGDKCLLANRKGWDKQIYSVLAGYVEPGESFEAAVKREVLEEAGIEVENIRYVGSQPWPFPSAVMVGFFAKAKSQANHKEIKLDEDELSHAKWFTKQELLSFHEKGDKTKGYKYPSKISISRFLLEKWVRTL